MRIPLELLPPPAGRSPPQRGSSAGLQASARSSSGRSLEGAVEQRSPGPSPAPEGQQGKKKKFGFVGVPPEPDGGWGSARKRPGRGQNGGAKHPELCRTTGGGDGDGRGARNAGQSRKGGRGWEEGGGIEGGTGGGGEEDPRDEGVVAAARNGAVGEGEAAAERRVRQREMVDLWWLTGEYFL